VNNILCVLYTLTYRHGVVDSQSSGNGTRKNNRNIDDRKPLTIMQIQTHYHMEFHRTAAHQYNIIIKSLAGYDTKTLAD